MFKLQLYLSDGVTGGWGISMTNSPNLCDSLLFH